MKIPQGFRGMKGERVEDFSKLTYPLLASVKLDGIRAFTFERRQLELLDKSTSDLYTLTLNQIPNRHIRSTLSSYGIDGLDGELITFTDGKMDSYVTVNSKVMSEAGKPDFKFFVFDRVPNDLNDSYSERLSWLYDNFNNNTDCPEICPVIHEMIGSSTELEEFEKKALLAGHEGVMVRSMDGPYKFGRSTLRQGYLLKVKRFLDAEATVTGFEELQHNENEATIDDLGLTKRSSHKANKRAGGMLGALVCCGHNGIEFRIGSGFTESQRREIWEHPDNYRHQLVKYKYLPHGIKVAPRHPIFLGFRDKTDFQPEQSTLI